MKKYLYSLPTFVAISFMLYNAFAPCAALMAQAVPGVDRPSGDVVKKETAAGKETMDTKKKTGEDNAELKEKIRPKIFNFDLGYKGSFSKGLAPSNVYSQPFVNFYLKNKYVKFTGGLSRFWDYQITNGAGVYERVNFTQPKLAFSVYPHEVIELYGSYRYSAGDKSHYYKGHEGNTGFSLDFEKVSLGSSFNYKRTAYIFYSDDRKDKILMLLRIVPPVTVLKLFWNYRDFQRRNKKYVNDLTLSPTFSWHMIKTASLDLSYEYFRTNFKNTYFPKYKPIYYTHNSRIGVSYDPWKYTSLTAGVSAGRGSDKYTTAGGDIGVVFNVLDYVKFLVNYMPVYIISPKINRGARLFLEYYSIIMLYGRRPNANPYMRIQDIGKSFWNHTFTFSVSYKY